MTKFSELPLVATPGGGDVVPIVSGGVTSRTTAQAIANLAPAQAGGTSSSPHGVYLDSYAGTTDDDKLTAAMSAQAAATTPQPILLGSRDYTFSTARVLYDGFALIGAPGMNNAELSNAGTFKTRVLAKGGGTWLSANGGGRSASQVWDVTIRNIAFVGNSSTQWMGGAAVLWVMNLRDCSWSSFKSVLGSQATKLLINLCIFDGWLSFNNSYTGGMHIGGSDNNLFLGVTNIDSGTAFNSAGSAVGQYHLWLDSMEKTVLGGIYITCEGPWGGLRVSGSAVNSGGSNRGGPLWIRGAKIEGRNSGAPCYGANVLMDGGNLHLTDCWLGYGMSAPASMGHSTQDAGIIHKSGGKLQLKGCTYDHATGVAETVPLLYQTGGLARVTDMDTESKGGAWTGLPRVTSSATGSTVGVTHGLSTDDSVTVV